MSPHTTATRPRLRTISGEARSLDLRVPDDLLPHRHTDLLAGHHRSHYRRPGDHWCGCVDLDILPGVHDLGLSAASGTTDGAPTRGQERWRDRRGRRGTGILSAIQQVAAVPLADLRTSRAGSCVRMVVDDHRFRIRVFYLDWAALRVLPRRSRALSGPAFGSFGRADSAKARGWWSLFPSACGLRCDRFKRLSLWHWPGQPYRTKGRPH